MWDVPAGRSLGLWLIGGYSGLLEFSAGEGDGEGGEVRGEDPRAPPGFEGGVGGLRDAVGDGEGEEEGGGGRPVDSFGGGGAAVEGVGGEDGGGDGEYYR